LEPAESTRRVNPIYQNTGQETAALT
jgi:hypothetical protein